MTEFMNNFAEDLENGANALEEAGYEVSGYAVSFEGRDTQISNWGDTPEEALRESLDEVRDEDQLFVYMDGEEFVGAIESDQDPSSLIERRLTGSLDVDEPTVEPDWADDPVPAFGMSVSYNPEQPEGYWEVQTHETQEPYSKEDAHERADDIIDVLIESDFEARKE